MNESTFDQLVPEYQTEENPFSGPVPAWLEEDEDTSPPLRLGSTRKRGKAPRDVITRIVMSAEEKEMLFGAADLAGANYSVWARQLLLAEAQKVLKQYDDLE